MGGRSIDWDKWREKYVTTDATLVELSKRKASPALQSLKNKSSEENWDEQRKRYRRELESRGAYDSAKNEIKPEVQAAIDQTNQIIDRAEMLTQHNILARKMLSIAGQAMKAMDPGSLKPADVEKFLKLGIDIQRTTEGMATSKTEIDLKGMSDDELNAIIDGNT